MAVLVSPAIAGGAGVFWGILEFLRVMQGSRRTKRIVASGGLWICIYGDEWLGAAQGHRAKRDHDKKALSVVQVQSYKIRLLRFVPDEAPVERYHSLDQRV